MAPFYNGVDLRIFVEIEGRLAGLNGLSVCGIRGKSFWGILRSFEETCSVLIDFWSGSVFELEMGIWGKVVNVFGGWI